MNYYLANTLYIVVVPLIAPVMLLLVTRLASYQFQYECRVYVAGGARVPWTIEDANLTGSHKNIGLGAGTSYLPYS